MSVHFDKQKNKYMAAVGSGPSRIRKTFSLKRDALVWESEMRTKIIQQSKEKYKPDMPIGEALEIFLPKLKGTTERHQREVKRILSGCIEEFEWSTIGDINLRDVEFMKNHSKFSYQYIKRKIIHLKHFSNYLEKMEYLNKSPLRHVEYPKGKSKRKRALQVSEVQELFRALQDHAPSIYEAMYFIAYTGLRKNEALTLEWENIDFRKNAVIVKNKPHLKVDGQPFYCKWGSERVVPLKDNVLEQLDRIKYSSASNWIFTNQIGDRLKSNINRAFINARIKSSIDRPDEVTPHTLRHTWISHLIDQGVSLKAVAELAGHKNLSTTEGYTHALRGIEKLHLDISKLPDF